MPKGRGHDVRRLRDMLMEVHTWAFGSNPFAGNMEICGLRGGTGDGGDGDGSTGDGGSDWGNRPGQHVKDSGGGGDGGENDGEDDGDGSDRVVLPGVVNIAILWNVAMTYML